MRLPPQIVVGVVRSEGEKSIRLGRLETKLSQKVICVARLRGHEAMDL